MSRNISIMTQPGWALGQRIRLHGESGPLVIALHGGPGAFGGAIRVARGLSDAFRVLEPLQRRSGGEPLSVATHVEDLHQLICSRGNGDKPALVGGSWGAMLALAYASEHSENVKALVLVGCGTFDKASRAAIVQTRRQRIMDYIAKHPEHKPDLDLDIGEQMMKWHGMTDSHEPVVDDVELPESEPFDMRGHTETWNDMVRCQEDGLYPQSFASIKVPAIMLHGSDDPHPGTMIRDTLRQHIPHLEYHEFQRCGHDPEMERYARDDFFAVLKDWLKNRFTEDREA